MPSLAHYMALYDHEHSSARNKMLHSVGISHGMAQNRNSLHRGGWHE